MAASTLRLLRLLLFLAATLSHATLVRRTTSRGSATSSLSAGVGTCGSRKLLCGAAAATFVEGLQCSIDAANGAKADRGISAEATPHDLRCAETYQAKAPSSSSSSSSSTSSSSPASDCGSLQIVCNRHSQSRQGLFTAGYSDEVATASCACHLERKRPRNTWAVISYGGNCGYESFGAHKRFSNSFGRMRKDQAFRTAAGLMVQTLTSEAYGWPADRIIVFGCEETVTLGDRYDSPTASADVFGFCATRSRLMRILRGEVSSVCADCVGGTPEDADDRAERGRCRCEDCRLPTGTAARGPKPGDSVLFYFRGHGGHMGGRGRYDSEKSKERSAVSLPNTRDQRGWTDDAFLDIDLTELMAGEGSPTTAIIDSCYSGGMVDQSLPEVWSSALPRHMQSSRFITPTNPHSVDENYVVAPEGTLVFTSMPNFCPSVRKGRNASPYTESLLRFLVGGQGSMLEASTAPPAATATVADLLSSMSGRVDTLGRAGNTIAPHAFGDADLLKVPVSSFFGYSRTPEWVAEPVALLKRSRGVVVKPVHFKEAPQKKPVTPPSPEPPLDPKTGEPTCQGHTAAPIYAAWRPVSAAFACGCSAYGGFATERMCGGRATWPEACKWDGTKCRPAAAAKK